MIEKILAEKTAEAIKNLYGHIINPSEAGIGKTKKEIPGDYTIVVFPFLKFSKESPEKTSEKLGTYLKNELTFVSEYQVIKGFLNIFLTNDFWISFLQKEAADKYFGIKKTQPGAPVLIEYSSPNTNKPLHLGHIRNNLLGYSIAEILKANGANVIKLNLVNDRGIHICKSMLAYMRWGNHETPESSGLKPDHLIGKYYVLFDKYYKDEVKSLVEKGTKEEDAAKQAPMIIEAQGILRKWEERDPATLALWQKMNSWAYEGFEVTYNKLGISFDKTQYESQTYLSGKRIVIEGVEKGFLQKREDGSVWADLTDKGLDEKLLLRSDGTSVYMTQDLGTADLRYEEFNPSKMIYVVGNEQNYHFDVLKKILKKLGKDWADRIFHLSYGMVELPAGKMKSREGNVVDADDLMEEMYNTAEETTRELGKVEGFTSEEAKDLFRIISLGALKYFILRVDPKKNMMFDPKESIDFNGNTGPFIQYTHARIRSLLKKATESNTWNEAEMTGTSMDLGSVDILQQEKEIFRLLYQFPEIVNVAGESLSPSVIASYVYDLSKTFNQFYQEVPVLKEPNPELVSLRLLMCHVTAEVVKKSMQMLGIEVPERM